MEVAGAAEQEGDGWSGWRGWAAGGAKLMGVLEATGAGGRGAGRGAGLKAEQFPVRAFEISLDGVEAALETGEGDLVTVVGAAEIDGVAAFTILDYVIVPMPVSAQRRRRMIHSEWMRMSTRTRSWGDRAGSGRRRRWRRSGGRTGIHRRGSGIRRRCRRTGGSGWRWLCRRRSGGRWGFCELQRFAWDLEVGRHMGFRPRR